MAETIWHQSTLTLDPHPRGFHLVTPQVEAKLASMPSVSVGLLHILLCHTSAGLTINENADPTVRRDFESHFNVLCPENAPYFQHTYEGADDMPAHLKASLLGSTLMLPVAKQELVLGIWQGIYLCEHRNRGGARRMVLTLYRSSFIFTFWASAEAPVIGLTESCPYYEYERLSVRSKYGASAPPKAQK